MARITEREFEELDARIVALHELVTMTISILCADQPFSAPQRFIGMLENSMADGGHNTRTLAHLRQTRDWLSKTLEWLKDQP